jgi:hypothetical protein
VRLCDQCTYAKEQDRLRKVPGANERESYLRFAAPLSPRILHEIMTVSIIPPGRVNGFDMGFKYACGNSQPQQWQVLK